MALNEIDQSMYDERGALYLGCMNVPEPALLAKVCFASAMTV